MVQSLTQFCFMPAKWRTPSRVFDAVHEFGALGNGSLLDAVPVQACVDAAAAHGRGASCYLRPGRFTLNQTIVLRGRDFIFEGAGITTQINAAMPPGPHENDSLVAISDTLADNIVVQQIATETNKNQSPLWMGPPTAGAGPRSLHIDYMMLAADGENYTGIVLRNLSATDIVRIGMVNGGVSVLGSSAATVLMNFHDGSYTTIARVGPPHGTHRYEPPPEQANDGGDGDDEAAASTNGFVGMMVHVPSGVVSLFVRDSSTFVVSDVSGLPRADVPIVVFLCSSGTANIMHDVCPTHSSTRKLPTRLHTYPGRLVAGHAAA